MSSSNLDDAFLPSDQEVEAAARELHSWGELHGWWPKSATGFDSLGPIEREEFGAIIERVLIAAAAQRAAMPDKP